MAQTAKKTGVGASAWLVATFLMLYLPTRDRIRKVTRSGDRGAGGTSIETVLLIIAVIAVIGVVIGVIVARVNAEKNKVTGGGDGTGQGNT